MLQFPLNKPKDTLTTLCIIENWTCKVDKWICKTCEKWLKLLDKVGYPRNRLKLNYYGLCVGKLT